MVHQKKWTFNWFLKFWRVSDDRSVVVVCSMMLVQQLQTHHHQSWYRNVEPGDRHVLPSGVENEQRLQRLIGRDHWYNQVRCQLKHCKLTSDHKNDTTTTTTTTMMMMMMAWVHSRETRIRALWSCSPLAADDNCDNALQPVNGQQTEPFTGRWRHISLASILSRGALFFAEKVDDLFLVVAFKT